MSTRGYIECLLRTLPDPRPVLRGALGVTPDHLSTTLLAQATTRLLAAQRLVSQLEELEGLCVALHVTDTGNHGCLRIENQRVRATRPDDSWHVRIVGTSNDFLRLALRLEDPDTLFFQRRLSLEGQTESGLHIKNLLDAVELDVPAFARAALGPRAGDWLAQKIQHLGVDTWAEIIKRDWHRRLDDDRGAAMGSRPRARTASPSPPPHR